MGIGVFGGTPSCPRCGGGHTARQRCPLDGPTIRDVPPIDEAPPRAPRAYTHAAGAPHRSGLSVAGAWLGGTIGTIVLFSSVVATGVFIAQLTQADEVPANALAGALASIVIGGLFGLGLLFLSARAYAKVISALLAVGFVTAGFLMMVFAPVARQMNTPELAEYRAFEALLSFGAATLAAGIVLSVLCVRWALRPAALARIHAWSRMSATIYGVLQGMAGLGLMLGMLALIDSSSGADQEGVAVQAIALTVICALSLAPGVLLTFHGISSMMGEGSNEFRPPIAVRWLLIWGLVLLGGGWAMRLDPPAAWPMPVLHVLAAALPGVVLVSLAARGSARRGRPVRGLTWRQVTLAAGIAISLGSMIAIYVESIGDLAAVVLMLVHHGAFETDVWDTLGESNDILSRNEQFVANLIAAAMVAPLIEEFAKGLGVRIMMRRWNTPSQAMVLGAAAGAGFGFLEALLYGVGGVVDHHETRWWLMMLLRGGSTSLHVFNTSLVGLAWWHWSFGKKPRTGWLLFGTAVLMHAAWNGLLVTLTSRIFGLETLSEHAIEVAAYIIVSGVALLLVGAIPAIARRLREPLAPPVEGTALAGMTPWLGYTAA
jgi:RsiW-degrading membrane proteinase PrsW (M82 family)